MYNYFICSFSGLDPALPLFITFNKDRRLDKTDAKFVDVLHTDALVEGKAESCGHIDFYMNGGLEQPGCWGGNIIGKAFFFHRQLHTLMF